MKQHRRKYEMRGLPELGAKYPQIFNHFLIIGKSGKNRGMVRIIEHGCVC
jgi:hypothetical protein